MEEPVPRGVVGPTFACIISKQFENIMKGDRLFFTHKHRYDKVDEGFDAGLRTIQKPNEGSENSTTKSIRGGLPAGLKAMIRKRTLSDIICDNIPIEEMQRKLFDITSRNVKCSENNKLNFITAKKCLDCAGDTTNTKDCDSQLCPGNKKKIECPSTIFSQFS